jgi:hypothetical protein
MTLIIAIGAVVWYATGLASFVWRWTKERDLTLREVETMLFAGVLGPVAFILCWWWIDMQGRLPHRVLLPRLRDSTRAE